MADAIERAPAINSATALDRFLARDLNGAEQVCQAILIQSPNEHETWHLLAVIFQATGRVSKAISAVQCAIRIDPSVAAYHNTSGVALGSEKDTSGAEHSFREALRLDPTFAPALNNLGMALEQCGKLAEAREQYRAALRSHPDDPEAYLNLGSALRKGGHLSQAEQTLRRAIELRPEDFRPHQQLAAVYREMGRLTEMLDYLCRVKSLQPNSASASSDLLYTLHYDPNITPEQLLAGHRAWSLQHGASISEGTRATTIDAPPNRRLRIGYVSPDFRRHTIARLIAPILCHHDRSRFEVFGYSNVKQPDNETRRLAGLCDHWCNILGLHPDAAANLIRHDRIDILVDLAGHMAGGSLEVFARRPAPIQVQLGYAGTTGLDAIDYRVTDIHCDPLGMSESHYTEKLLRLPNCAWCYEPDADSPPVAPSPFLINGHIAFGSLNNPIKITDSMIELWVQIRAITESRG